MTTQMDKFKHLSIYKVLLIWLAKLKLTEAHRAKAYYMAESERTQNWQFGSSSNTPIEHKHGRVTEQKG